MLGTGGDDRIISYGVAFVLVVRYCMVRNVTCLVLFV